MKNFIWACSLLFVVGCAGSAGDLVSDNGRAEFLDDSFIDANGNDIEDKLPDPSEDSEPTTEGSGGDNQGGGTDPTAPGEPEVTTNSEDHCINESDQSVLQSEDPDFDDLISSCSETCFSSQSNNENCIRDCLTDESDISEECAQCYNTAMVCYIEDCFSMCSEENNEEECNTCLSENCFTPFFTCSGINPEDF